MLIWAMVFCTSLTCQVATTNVTKEMCETSIAAANRNAKASGGGIVFKCMSRRVETWQ